MKKFIFTSPLQPEVSLKLVNYQSMESNPLENALETRFPIIPVINAYANENEKIEIIVILTDYENCRYNYEKLFKPEITSLQQTKKFEYETKIINTPYDETIQIQLDLFSDLISHIDDNDEIFVCITYGTKPIPIVQIMALNYAYKLRKETNIGCIVYGRNDFSTGKAYIHDVSPLFFMDSLVSQMAQLKLENPEEKIKGILGIE